MPHHLYRRHRRDCNAGHVEDSRTGEFEERRKGHKRCSCPIFAGAQINGKRSRKSTGRWEWDAAKSVVAAWDGLPATKPDPAPSNTAETRTTIREATDAFQARATNKGIADGTLRKYRTFIKQVVLYADKRGYAYIDQLTIDDMDRFYAGLTDGPVSKGKKLGMLRSFVKFALKRKWLKEDIAEDLEAPKGTTVSANKSPFTDDEMDRIYAACDKLGPAIPGGPGARPWSGEDAKDFVYLSTYTGLRISDVCLFDIDKRLNGNDVFLRMHKTKKELYTWIPDWLVARLRDRERRYGKYIFLIGTSMNVKTVTEQWRRRMQMVFRHAKPFDERPYPHRFRGTFARILLEKGVPLSDVAVLIGDTEQVVLKFYAKWMPGRQTRLTQILKAAFQQKPKLLVMEGRG
jgi:site-specific recombinase XerD